MSPSKTPSIFPESTYPGSFRGTERLPRISLLLFAAALLTTAVAQLTGVSVLSLLGYVLELAASFVGLRYLLRYSAIRKSSWRIAFVIIGVCWVLGALAKLQHWPLANTLLPVASLSAAVIYLLWTLRKPRKVLLDYLKLLWVLLVAGTAFGRLQHLELPLQDLLLHISPALLQILVWMQSRAVQRYFSQN